MAVEVRRRRGTTAQHASFTGAAGEVTVDTDKKTVVVHDGVTAGGFPLASHNPALMNYGGYQFDGSTDYLDGNALTGIADSKVGTIALLVRFGTTASATERVFDLGTSNALGLLRTSTGNIQLVGDNSAGTQILGLTSGTFPCLNPGLYLILLSWDLNTPGTSRLFINDVSHINESTYTNDTVDLTGTECSIGASVTGTAKFTGDVYAFWFDPTTRLEFNTQSVRRKFADAAGVPMFLGRNGELPTGSPPILFLGYDDYTSWARNRGTATSSFTENGTPGAVGTALSGQYAPLEAFGLPKTVTADHTVDRTTTTIINNKSGSALSVTLPAAASNRGRRLRLVNWQAQAINSASSNVVPIAGGAAGAAIVAGTAGLWGEVESDGTNWNLVAA